MSKLIVGMTLSLDGYMNDASGSVAPLYTDFDALLDFAPMLEAIRDTGAVLMGRRTFAMAADPDEYAATYEFRVPLFVLTHTPPARHPREAPPLTFTFVTTGLADAVAQAKAAAGPKDVTVVGGASLARQLLQAGLADELHLDFMPILLGGGQRFFDTLGPSPLHLERLDLAAAPSGRTHLKYRILK